MPDYHKCAKIDCNAKTSKEFCRHHVVKYNQCPYEGCLRRCRKEFCGFHKPEVMEYRRNRYNTIYGPQRKTAKTPKLIPCIAPTED